MPVASEGRAARPVVEPWYGPLKVKGYKVTDRRRVTATGQSAARPITNGRTRIAHKDILKPLEKAGDFLVEHVRRGVESGALRPSLHWSLVLGLLISARQTYAAVTVLMSSKRMVRTLPAQAQVLVRTLFEGYANLMALLQAPSSRSRLYARDAYRRLVQQQSWLRRKYGRNPKWTTFLDDRDKVISAFAAFLGLRGRSARNPARYLRREWPTPGGILFGAKGNKKLVRGNRRRALKEVYDLWYGVLSGLEHQRLVGIGTAMLVHLGDEGFDQGLLESNTVLLASLILTCIYSEVEVAGAFPVRVDLRVLWEILRSADDEAAALYRIRYKRLLRMP